MKISLYLDSRRMKKDGTCTLKIVICHHSKNAMLSTDISVDPKNWDSQKQRVSGKEANWKNAEIHQQLLIVEQHVHNIVNMYGDLCAIDIKNKVQELLARPQSNSTAGVSIVDYYKRYADEHHGRTKEKYYQALDKMRNFDNDLDGKVLDDINVEWLSRFNNYMLPKCPSANTRSMHLRCLKAVLKRAEDEDVIRKSPFRIFKIPKAMPKHRDISVSELRELLNWPIEPQQQKYRDFFWLSFMMRGINNIDLLLAKWSDVNGGYLEYDRQKTHKSYKIKLEPEMMEIINRWKGKDNLLEFLDGVSFNGDEEHDNEVREQVHVFTSLVNHNLKRIGVWNQYGRFRRIFVESRFPKLYMYVARHTWSTIAYDISDDYMAVSDGLGHTKHVTDIYVKRTQRKVDNVTRKMIDYVLNL